MGCNLKWILLLAFVFLFILNTTAQEISLKVLDVNLKKEWVNLKLQISNAGKTEILVENYKRKMNYLSFMYAVDYILPGDSANRLNDNFMGFVIYNEDDEFPVVDG